MYERIEIWKRDGAECVIRFQCLRRASDGMFAVQNADYFRNPISTSVVQSSDLRFVELLLDDDPENRCDWYSSLNEAISHHEQDFEGMSEKS